MKDNWKPLNIGEEINILSGYPFNSKLFNNGNEGKPLIRIRDILNSSIETYFSGSYNDLFLIKKGDILVGMDGEFHISKWNNIDALLNQRILKVSQKKNAEIDIDYFYFFLFSFLKQVHNITPATTVKHLSTFDIKKAVSAFPPISHQGKIAKVLNTLDAVIEKTEAAIAKYKAVKQGMMQDLFTRGIDLKTGKLRPSKEDAPNLYKETELGWIPKEWEEILIGNEINVLSGAPFDSKKFNQERKGIPIIRIRDILHSTITTYYSGNFSEFFLIKKGDILISMDGDFHIAKWNNINAILNQRILKVSQKKDARIEVEYFYYFLKPFLSKIHRITPATTVKHLSTFNITRASEYFPSVKEQKEIASRLSIIDQLIVKDQLKLSKYGSLKKGLMHDLLTRKVEVEIKI